VNLLQIYLKRLRGMVVEATTKADPTETAKRIKQVITLVFLVKMDVPRLIRIIEILEEQRNGYRENYWAVMKVDEQERKEIAADNDAEIYGLISEGLKGLKIGNEKV
jgi:hypothetical protein